MGECRTSARSFGVLAVMVGLARCGSPTRNDAGLDSPVDAGSDRQAMDVPGASCSHRDAGDDTRRRFLDMRITGLGFEAHNGASVHLYTSRGVLDEVYGAGEATIAGGGFTFDFPGACQRGYQQSISWFVDADKDGVCNAAA